MSKELIELKNIADYFFSKADAFVKTIKAQEQEQEPNEPCTSNEVSNDPHAKNKALYAQDALVHKKPWTLWEFDNGDGLGWLPLSDGNPCWFTHSKYRRKQTKKPHGEEEKLDGGQKHLLRLIARDQQNAEGWCAVSAVIYPIVQKTMPADLVEHYQVEDGRGRARLTLAGENLIDAMAWL